MIGYIKHNKILIQVTHHGAHAGWLNKVSRRTAGHHAASMTSWEGTVCGKRITAATLNTAIKTIGIILSCPAGTDAPDGTAGSFTVQDGR